jgi:type IV pilus assembly protein PilA
MGPVPGGKNFIGGVAMRQQKGFTLIELLVVIAIIAILASLAIPSYLSYQRRARVSSYAEPIARACLLDWVAYCIDNPDVTSISPVVGPTASAPNCRNTTVPTAGGNVNLSASGIFSCSGGSLYISGTGAIGIIATLTDVSDYRARCYTANNSVKCVVEGM